MASALLRVKLQFFGRSLPLIKIPCQLLSEALSWAMDGVRDSSICRLISKVPGLGALHPGNTPFRVNWAGALHLCGHNFALLQINACLPSTAHRLPSSSKGPSQQWFSQLLDDQQFLKRQLKYTQQQHAASAEAGFQARAQSQRLTKLLAAAQGRADVADQHASKLHLQLLAQADTTSTEQDAPSECMGALQEQRLAVLEQQRDGLHP
ncbi:hypothetical protein WJX74_002132 [Apatococcus lobatus]|uniref:Uncharacterized protein n=1 Tax=Apatococcus lobatus TaxID=904363 RepID=A0AAW1QXL0_9CHLO